MSKFIKLNKVSKLERNGNVIEVFKYRKEGTQRIFFAPEFDGTRINATMFARMYDAEGLGRQFLKFVK